MIALDTNLLVYAHRSALPEHRAAKSAIEEAARHPTGWGIAMATVAEFWAVVTHPASSGRPSRPAEARDFLEAILDGGGRLWTPQPGFGRRLMHLAAQTGLHGPRIFDLQIGLTAAENGATEIWTRDRRFVAPPGLRVHDPLA